jgi:hypothetical protein
MPEPTYQALPFPVRVKRWFEDPTQWTMVAGLVSTLGPIALNSIGLLHLSDQQTFFAIVCLNAALWGAGAWLNYWSSHVIGNKDEVSASKASP